jgi:mono/diheme cytochrome c family protein
MPATEDYLRDPKLMHKVFCGSALAMLGATVWMMWADYADEWRGFQRQALQHVAARDRAQVASIQSNPEYEAQLQAAQEQLQLAEQALKTKSAEVKTQKDAADHEVNEAAKIMRKLREERAKRDVARAVYGLKIRDSAPADEQEKFLQAYDDQQAQTDKFENNYKVQDLRVQEAKAKLAELTQVESDAKKALKTLTADVSRLKTAINKIEPSNWFVAAKRDLMLLPIINGFNSPERITQDWMPRLEIDLGGMTKVDRFDRCRTCHYMIDSVGQGTDPAFPHGDGKNGTYTHPYSSHPRLDLFLTSTSPHPLPKFGCTVCHEGQGSGTTFQNASHTPNDPGVMQDWQKKYGWFDNHFWEHPMYPERFEESSCIKCHINVVELGVNSKFGPTAPKVFRGYQLVKTYGCFGCHEINGFDGTRPVGPDLRLEPSTAEEAEKLANDPLQVAGKMRKVGPSLRHIGAKSEAGFIAHWTEEPKRFRPTTRMPQFFKLDNQHDAMAEKYNPLELAGMTTYLLSKSQGLEPLKPTEGYQPNAARGKELFATRGCVACHTHGDLPGVNADFGPELSRVHAKIKPGLAGYEWLYTWIREPERHHPRTKMPHLFLDPEGTGDKLVDPAADIAAFLLKLEGSPADFKTTASYPEIAVNDADLDELVKYFLGKLLTQEQIDGVMASGNYPIAKEKVKGDEIELFAADPAAALDPAEWKQRKLVYVGRKTITKYGCYGCHDIPNFEAGRPIGTALQDWGKKDRSRLAFEHIHEYLHHHGQPGLGLKFETLTTEDAARLKLESPLGVRLSGLEPGAAPLVATRVAEGHAETDALRIDDVILGFDGQAVADAARLRQLLRSAVPATEVDLSVWRDGAEVQFSIRPDGSTQERVTEGLKAAERGEFKNPADEERERSAAYYYETLLHHGRPGFLWQKLRQPRSYDYKMVETKPYDDRLRMPKFPFSEEDIDAIATFVLGLTAEPPHVDYMYMPSGVAGAKIRGEYLLEQYNCAGCHMLEMPEIRYGANLDDLAASDLSAEFPQAVELLHKLKPPRQGLTAETHVVKHGGETKTRPVVGFHGIVVATPNPDDDPDDQEYVAELWETLKVGDKELVPTTKVIFPAAALQEIRPAVGGKYAEWLAERLFKSGQVKQLPLGWQAAPPPLYLEGIKVQTPWLYNFLRNPGKIRHTTVLRMPRFNMSDEEARSLANYFAAQDGAEYPYQALDEREPAYLSAQNAEFKGKHPDISHDYLTESWKALNSPLCIKCHAVGGRLPISTDPANDIRAPNLEQASERLRPDWLLLWLYKSPWITPYTSMPQNFPPGKQSLPGLFGGDNNQATIGVRDALLNYHRLMERDGRIVYDPPLPPMPNATGTAAAEKAPSNPATTAAESGGTN